jgi:SAM-dependent methyltransferase
MIITKVSPERWKQAQEFELEASQTIARRGDDYNHWWMKQFDNYELLKDKYFENVLEVGCGPNTNARLILPLIGYKNLWLDDPLMNEYLRIENSIVRSIGKSFYNEPIERLSMGNEFTNLLICINVLDHVQDAELCFMQMKRVLKPDGILILGQDLSDEEDYKQCPDSWEDIGHPIKLDHQFLYGQLDKFTPLFDKILPREQGRNPRCHYGTLLYMGNK